MSVNTASREISRSDASTGVLDRGDVDIGGLANGLSDTEGIIVLDG
jgi:hypothetical protein